MVWTKGEIITSVRLEDLQNSNQASGFASTNNHKIAQAHRYKFFIGGFGNNFTTITGTFIQYNNSSQTDFDDILVSTAGYILNQVGSAVNDGIKWSNVTLNAGNYNITMVTSQDTAGAIIQLMHASTFIGSFDCYGGGTSGQVNNLTTSFNYAPTNRKVGDFSLVAASHNTNSTGYRIPVSRLEIFKTA